MRKCLGSQAKINARFFGLGHGLVHDFYGNLEI